MTSIGETLRSERMRRNLELEKIAGQLKIPKRFLEAIEDEKFDQLPGGVFVKSFVRQYADALGLDADEMSAEVQRMLAPPLEAPPPGAPSKQQIPEIRVENMEEWRSVGSRYGSWSSSWMAAGVLVILAIVACSFVYWWWWQRPLAASRARESAAASSASASQITPSSMPTATPAATTPAENAPPPTAPETRPLTVTPPESTSTRAVRVAITAKEAVWIRASADGKILFSGTLNEAQTRNFDGDAAVELRLGNAGGATIAYNGKPVSLEGLPEGTIGPKGQVRTVQLTPEGFHLVVPPPKPPEIN
jgi:cytoskeletal protein RodZ